MINPIKDMYVDKISGIKHEDTYSGVLGIAYTCPWMKKLEIDKKYFNGMM